MDIWTGWYTLDPYLITFIYSKYDKIWIGKHHRKARSWTRNWDAQPPLERCHSFRRGFGHEVPANREVVPSGWKILVTRCQSGWKIMENPMKSWKIFHFGSKNLYKIYKLYINGVRPNMLNQSFYRGISEYMEGIDMVRWFNRPCHPIAFRELVNHSRNWGSFLSILPSSWSFLKWGPQNLWKLGSAIGFGWFWMAKWGTPTVTETRSDSNKRPKPDFFSQNSPCRQQGGQGHNHRQFLGDELNIATTSRIAMDSNG